MTRRHKPHGLRITMAAVLAVAVAVGAGPAGAQTPEPYTDPPFSCQVIDYGSDPPTLPAPAADPLCVRYDKTNATVSTLGIVDFLAAEPGRVAIVAAKCSYWQQDRWIIRATPDTPPLVAWNGSYWYDARSGSAGGVLRDLRIGDQPAGGEQFIEAIRPIVGDSQADELRRFVDDGGGGGLTMALPESFGFEECAQEGPTPGPDQGEEPSPGPDEGEHPTPGAGVQATTTSAAGQRQRLPATGGTIGSESLLLVAAGLAARAAARRMR